MSDEQQRQAVLPLAASVVDHGPLRSAEADWVPDRATSIEADGVGGDADGRSPLLPERRSDDLFICDILDAAPKGDMASMEHPMFSLSTKPDRRVRRYEHGQRWIEIAPSSDGLATVHDRDILIYCISQIVAALNADPKRTVSPLVRLTAHDLLVATNRRTNGDGYLALKAALKRLQGTQISTNIETGGIETFEVFSLINRARIVRETREGRMRELEVELSDWTMRAILAREVLTLHRDYFRLRKPLERRMYEIARKHCGRQREWQITLDLLQKKCGSNSTLKEFRRLVSAIAEQDRQHGHFPDYRVALVEDVVFFTAREVLPRPQSPTAPLLPLKDETLAYAKTLLPRHDIHHVAASWRAWASGKPAPDNPDGAFIAFCKTYGKNNPL